MWKVIKGLELYYSSFTAVVIFWLGTRLFIFISADKFQSEIKPYKLL